LVIGCFGGIFCLMSLIKVSVEMGVFFEGLRMIGYLVVSVVVSLWVGMDRGKF